jgi:uncharacterized protein YyaL (SSP411 family)
VIDFLLHYHARFGAPDALPMATAVLCTMAGGGIHDQIGGGFHRYSVDARWLVPHFEKMLYDNALLARLYTRAAQATRTPGPPPIPDRTLTTWHGDGGKEESPGFAETSEATRASGASLAKGPDDTGEGREGGTSEREESPTGQGSATGGRRGTRDAIDPREDAGSNATSEEFARIAGSTLDYLLREMRHERGGFFSSQDADSEGEEGRFYVWEEDEILDILRGDAIAMRPGQVPGQAASQTADSETEKSIAFLCDYWEITPAGNWEARNILNAPRPLAEVAAGHRLSIEAAEAILRNARRVLYEARARRVWPGRDEKILTAWNALALHAFAEAGRVLRRPDYTAVAIRNAEFLLGEMWIDGVLHRVWRDGVARIPAFLDDHAMLVDALIELYRTTFDPRWIREARRLADTMIARFWSEDEGIFHDTPSFLSDALIVRPREIHDNPIPSGTSAAAHALTRLARLTGDRGYDAIADRVTAGMVDLASRVPRGFAHLLGALAVRLAPPTEVAIIGDLHDPRTRALLDALDSRFLPDTTVVVREPHLPMAEAAAEFPLLADREAPGGIPTAFVCVNFSCRLPVHTPHELHRELDAALSC